MQTLFVRFVDNGGIVYHHHCLSLLFIICRNLKVMACEEKSRKQFGFDGVIPLQVWMREHKDVGHI